MSLRFEWDARKAVSNRRKHDVTFEEASTVLSDVQCNRGRRKRNWGSDPGSDCIISTASVLDGMQ